jgi:UDP-glucose 4-epimerase
MKILITGGNGNIAKLIFNGLQNLYEITRITRENFDLKNYNEFEKYVTSNNFDILIHTAIKGGRRLIEDTSNDVYDNLLVFENVIKLSKFFKLIINFDSGAIYDRSTDINFRKEEDLNTIPNDYYGFSKYLIYKRSLQYNNIINLRIFNIFHVNEEKERFIKSCFLAKKNKTKINIFQDKYFDFVYEDDFVKIVKYYIDHFSEKLPKTLNISYNQKYKLSEIAEMIITDKELIEVNDTTLKNNYCGDGNLLNSLNLKLDGLQVSLKKYENKLN